MAKPRATSAAGSRPDHNPPAAAAPAKFDIPDDALPPEFHLFRYGTEAIEEEVTDELERLPSMPASLGARWIDVSGFGDEGALRQICEQEKKS